MTLRIKISERPSEADRRAVLIPLHAFNAALAGESRQRPVAVMLKDDDGLPVGGLWGKCVYDWLIVEFLAVPQEHRGKDLGTRLMQVAETIARNEGCIGIWLDTYGFQARGFYEKLGFEVFGELRDQPLGHSCFFLSKRIAESPSRLLKKQADGAKGWVRCRPFTAGRLCRVPSASNAAAPHRRSCSGVPLTPQPRAVWAGG